MLTDAQHETLLHGAPILSHHPREAFQTEAEMALAWRTHRRALLAEFDHPGQRPWGFWRFDVGADPVPSEWWKEATELERAGLMERAEEIRLERTRRELAPDQAGLYDAVFAHQGWGEYMLRRFQAEFAFAAGWHGRRGRTQLQEKYTRLAQAARAELEKP